MMKKTIDTVYILGLGALGSIYAALLHEMNPGAVKIIANQNRLSALKNSKITVNGKAYAFDFVVPGDQSPSPVDLIIIAVKSPQLQQAVDDIRGFVSKDTIVISLLNGILSEDTIGQQIGFEHILYTYAVGMDAVRQGAATNYKNPGKIVFGEKNNNLSENVIAVKNLFERARIPYDIPADMHKALWFKFMMNTGINQASAVLKAPYGVFQQNEEARKLMLMAAEEVLFLSQKTGIDLNQSDMDDFLRIVDGLNPLGKTSMLQDIEAGRKSEVDIFAGTVIELGKKYGVPTPVNDTIGRIILSMESMASNN
jgi:2-dehydropantoate 2-reductase